MRFNKIIFVLCTALALGLVSGVSRVKADGGIFYPDGRYMNETSQKAFIYYQNQTENLVLSASYQGNSDTFAWVIPTPSKPEIFKSDAKLFTALQKITKTNDSGSGIVYDSAGQTFGVSGAKPVEVIEEKTIDIYDTAILKATNDKDLARWLTDHKYTFPEDKSSMLKEYIDNGWYFAIAKIQNALVSNEEIKDKLVTETITPLRLVFKTDKIIYPMKLTRLALESAEKSSPKSIYSPNMYITLYVLSDSKTAQNLLETKWSNWISSGNINKLNSSVAGENWIQGSSKMFLTKMASNVNIKNVEDDFLVTKAPSNDVYPVPPYKTFAFWIWNIVALLATLFVAILSPIGLLFTVIALLQVFIIRRRWLYILGNIYQMLACLLPLFIGFIFLVEVGQSFPTLILESGFIGISLGLLLIEIVGIFFTVKMIKKYKKVFSS
ncbi:MAG: DUF2330 domain-containing protein [Candidatus Berkelbacteria bacterium]|nr:DUF2330 domain-containing protein [Candidatus Berkelbacteria bacterium]